jgi:hypothetical protein
MIAKGFVLCELPTARGCGLPEIYSGTLSTSPKITTGNQLVLYSLHACNRLFQTISEKLIAPIVLIIKQKIFFV